MYSPPKCWRFVTRNYDLQVSRVTYFDPIRRFFYNQVFFLYRFDRANVRRTPSASSTADSGVSFSTADSVSCLGCLSMYCKDCLAAQNLALKQVESLLNRLERAESLYQSTKAMGAHYPLYKSEAFVARVKAMCLWYNMTRHHRLKLLILGKLLAR